MGLGNGNSKSGDKGSNHNYEHRHLLALGDILTAVVPVAGLATEATLLDVLTAVDSMRDYEVRLVVDSDTPAVTWLEVRYWDAQTGALGTPLYYPPGSTVAGTPVGALTYINPNTYLAMLNAELIALNAGGPLLTEATFSATKEIDNDAIAAFDFLKSGGKAVDPSTYSPGYTADDAALFSFDKDSGKLLVQGNGNLVTSVFVLDSAFPSAVVWEARYTFNPITNTWSVIYYDQDGVSGTPSGALTFIEDDNNLFLASIEGSSQGTHDLMDNVTSDDNDGIITHSFYKSGGKAVDTATYSPGYTADDGVEMAFDKDNGGLLVNQANLAIDEDEVLNHVGSTDSNFGVPSKFRNTSVTNTALAVKASAGNLYGWNIINPNPLAVYIKFYDLAAASVVVGTTVPVKTLMIPAGGSVYQSPEVREETFATAIAVVATRNRADSDSTAPISSIHVELKYK